MRLIPTTVLLVLLSSLAFAQTEKLPDTLKPDAVSEADARRMGAKVFKLLPYAMFNKWPWPVSTKDEDNPIGIRGGGSYYSFTSQSHSFNKNPQIATGPMPDVGIHGYGSGFVANLGRRDLAGVDASVPEARYILSYKLPLLQTDYAEELKTFDSKHGGQLILWHGSRPLVVGNVYLVRSITLEMTDTVVAFQILRNDSDGSGTIAWKKLVDFPTPFVLSMPDEELQAKVNAIIAEESIIGVKILVKDNWLYSLGPNHNDAQKVERSLLRNGVRFRGAGGKMP